MPCLYVRLHEEEHRIIFDPGPSIRDILEQADLPVRTGCRGHGACGLCEIRLLDGPGPEPTLNERLHIPAHRLAQGVRLACQVRPQIDLRLEVINPAPLTPWQSLPVEALARRTWPLETAGLTPLQNREHPLGVAVDLGTNHIRLGLFDLAAGQCLACRRGPNPQIRFGADVLTRLVAAREAPDTARELSALSVSAIGEGLRDMASREGIDLHRVARLAVVANTPMLSLLAGKNHQLLLQPRFWQSPIDCRGDDPSPWIAAWNIHPRAEVRLIPPLAGFVGSDLLAGLTATRLVLGPAPALFIDLGTNSEIALWDGGRLWVTSAAGGPAFEISSLTSGVPAGPGAIYRVSREPDGALRYQVMGEEKALGFCGSGLVDLIARLLETGQLASTGRFTSGALEENFVVGRNGHSLVLTMGDIDALQRAKAAIGAGIQVLAGEAEVELADLRRVCVAGEFGAFLDVTGAQALGLLPRAPAASFELCGDAALLGCADLILSTEADAHLADLRRSARLINLSQTPDFEELFLANLYLQPAAED